MALIDPTRILSEESKPRGYDEKSAYEAGVAAYRNGRACDFDIDDERLREYWFKGRYDASISQSAR